LLIVIRSGEIEMPTKPVVDIRTYTIRRGVAEFLRLYEELALPIAIKHWGPPVAFYVVSEIGPLNQVSHLWEFESLADLELPRRNCGRSGVQEISGCNRRHDRRAGGPCCTSCDLQKPVLRSVGHCLPDASYRAALYADQARRLREFWRRGQAAPGELQHRRLAPE
jgi:hypothetical protein